MPRKISRQLGELAFRARDHAFQAIARTRARFHLSIKSSRCGFFGDLFQTMNGVRYCEQLDIPCVVEWGSSSLYFDAEQGQNVWTYYFAPIDKTPPQNAGSLGLPYRPGAGVFKPYHNMSIRRSIATAFERHLKPKSFILDEVDAFFRGQVANRAPLGVHIRLTDAASQNEKRKQPSVDDFVRETSRLLGEQQDQQVFLATDDDRVVDTFRSEFGNLIIARDCLRSSSDLSIHGHYDSGLAGSGFEKGKDVLIDALILARCDQIIRHNSGVSQFALCLNPTLPFVDIGYKYYDEKKPIWLFNELETA